MNDVKIYDPSYNYEEAKRNQDQSSNRPVYNPEEDTSKWEIDMEPIWDSIKHQLMGEIEENGEWIRSEFTPRRMNEKGATILIMEVKARIHKGLILSTLSESQIQEICYNVGCTISDQVANRWREFEVKPYESEFESICSIIVDNMIACLNTAKDGGMKDHRERSKFPNPVAYAHNIASQGGL